LIYALFVPLGAQWLTRIGMRRSLRISVFFDASYYVCLFMVSYSPSIFLPLSVIIVTFGRMTFWLPYHVDFAKFTDRSNRGKEVSLLWATNSLLGIVLPLVSGFLIGIYGFHIVFVMAILMFLVSGIPFLALPKTGERFEWTYFQTFKHFFSRNNRKMVMANMANGAENAVAIIIWPIFIWQLLKGNYFAVGVFSSCIVFITVILQLIVGKYLDLFNKRKMLHWGSFLYATGWFAKIFVLTAFQSFIAGAYHSITQIFKDTPFDTLNYENLADKGHYVDEYTVIKEVAVQLGKVLVLSLAVFVSLYFGLNWTFVLAAIASLLISLL